MSSPFVFVFLDALLFFVFLGLLYPYVSFLLREFSSSGFFVQVSVVKRRDLEIELLTDLICDEY